MAQRGIIIEQPSVDDKLLTSKGINANARDDPWGIIIIVSANLHWSIHSTSTGTFLTYV